MKIYVTVGDLPKNPFVIGTSNRCEYKPLYSIGNRGISDRYLSGGEISEYIPHCNNINSYHKPSITERNDGERTLSTYNNLTTHLFNCVDRGIFGFTYDNKDQKVFVYKGCIIDEQDNILLLTTVKDEDIYLEDNPEKVDVSKMKIFVSFDLVNKEFYKNFYKKINSNYISQALQQGIRLEFCTSEEIEKKAYSNDFDLQFKTLTDLDEHLKSGIGKMLFTDNNDFIPRVQRPILTNPYTPDGILEEPVIINPIVEVNPGSNWIDAAEYAVQNSRMLMGFDPASVGISADRQGSSVGVPAPSDMLGLHSMIEATSPVLSRSIVRQEFEEAIESLSNRYTNTTPNDSLSLINSAASVSSDSGYVEYGTSVDNEITDDNSSESPRDLPF